MDTQSDAVGAQSNTKLRDSLQVQQRRQVRRSAIALTLLAFSVYASFIAYAVLHGRQP
jgi:hypothetical protein